MTSDFPGYGGRGPIILKITWAECAIALALFTLRAASASTTPRGTPIRSLYGLRWDFVFVTIAMILASTAQAFLTISVLHGTGNHQDVLTVDGIVMANFWSWMAQILAILGATTGRIAVILFLLYIQSGVKGRLKWVLYVVGAATTTINIIEIGLILHQCQPVQALWDIRIKGDCSFIPITTKVGYLQGGIGALADFTLAIYPAFVIGRLQQMRWVIKVGLSIVMAGGLVAGSAAIVKTIAIGSITKTEDITYATWSLLAWVWTEMWLIIILGSIPPLWQLIKTFTMKAKDALTSGTHTHTRTLSESTGYKSIDRESAQSRIGDPKSRGMHNFQLGSLSSNRDETHLSLDSATESKEDMVPPVQPRNPPRGRIVVTREVGIRSETNIDVCGGRDEFGTFLNV